MLETVIKRDGRIVEFDAKKIRKAVALAMQRTKKGVDEEIIEKIIDYVESKNVKQLSVEEIHDIVEKRLMSSTRKDAAREYVKERHRRDVARQSKTKVMFDEIVATKANDITRENANMNADTPAGMMMKFASETTKTFVDNYLISEDVKEYVDNNIIHIHDKDYYPTKSLTCLSGDTFITLKDSKGRIINTQLSFFDKYFKNAPSEDAEVVSPEDYYYIKGRNGWTKVINVSRHAIKDDEKFYFIKTKKGIGLKVTGTHQIPVFRSGVEILIPVKDIEVGDELIGETISSNYFQDEYIDVVSELLKISEEYRKDIVITNIKNLKKYLDYKYDVTYLSREIGSETYRNGVNYITLEQFNKLTEKFDIPFDVLNTLEVKVFHGKDSLPLYIPVSNELAEIIGYVHSEGCVHYIENSSSYQISFCNYDERMNERFYDSFTKVFTNKLVKRFSKNDNGEKVWCGWLFSSKLLSLIFTNVFGKKSVDNISIPNFIMNGTDELKWHYISAIIDGDGCLKDRQCIKYCTVSENFAKNITILLDSLDVKSSVYSQQKYGEGSVATFGTKLATRNYNPLVVVITGYDNLKTVCDNLVCIKQKSIESWYASAPKKSNVSCSFAVTDKIEINGSGISVYDIETVEHWFVANNYIVHNCIQHPLDRIFEHGFRAGHGESRAPKRIETAAIIACISMETVQNEMHGGQAIPAFDFYLAPYVRATYKEEIDKISSLHGIDHSNLKDAEIDDYIVKPLDGLSGDDRWKQHAINETVNRVHQAMEAFIHNMNQIHSRGGNQVVFSSVNYGTDTSAEGRCVIREILNSTYEGVGNGSTAIFPIQIWKKKRGVSYLPEDPNYDLYKLACKVSARRFFPNFLNLDASYNVDPLWDENDPKRYIHEVATMGCRTRVYGNRFGEYPTSIGRGNLSFTTINLPKLAIEAALTTASLYEKDGKIVSIYDEHSVDDALEKDIQKETISLFFDELNKALDIVAKQLDERYQFQSTAKAKQFPLLMSGLWNGSEKLKPEDTIESVIKHGTLGVGFIGLAETLVALVGKHHGESEDAQKLGLEIVSLIDKRCKEFSDKYNHNYSCFATPAEGLSGKFTKVDKKEYGEIKGVTDKDYYTNSNHVPVWYHCSAKHKAEIEAPYHKITPAGHIFYVELDGELEKNPEAVMNIVDLMDKYDIGYGSFNHNVARCDHCCHESVKEFPVDENGEKYCPVCGSKNVSVLQRITGYLVSTVDRWNSGKQAEFRDRIQHEVQK